MRFRILVFTVFTVLLIGLVPHFNVAAQDVNPVWFGQYYASGDLSGSPAFSRNDTAVIFNWGFTSPANLPVDGFSIRWITDAYFQAGTYRFWILADDNVRLTVDYTSTVIDTFATGQVDQLVSVDVPLAEGYHHLQIDYREIVDEAFIYFDFANRASNPLGPDFAIPVNPLPTGIWTASYYANPNLVGDPFVIRSESQAGGNWGNGSPIASLPVDNWSARWIGTLFLEGGNYAIRADADDGIRVYIDSVLVIDEWHIATRGVYQVDRNLSAGNHSFVVEFFESGGIAYARFDIEQRQAPVVIGSNVTVISALLNVREQPNFANPNILTRVSYGQSYPALARTADGAWVKINVNGIIGWVNTNFVNVTNLSALPVETVSTPVSGFTVTASPYTVNIRTGPGTEFRDIGNLPAGQSAQLIGRNADSTWWQINFNGIVGWVSAFYTNVDPQGQVSEIPVTG